jgi:cytoskeletal protein CcmA (bactofilin family)
MARIDTVIGKTALLNGGLEFSGGLHVDGRIRGGVRAIAGTDSTLTVGEEGRIEGAVIVTHLILDGSVSGPVYARGRVVLGARARVSGDVYYGAIEMALGAEIMGRLVPIVDGAISQDAEALLTAGH